MTNAPETWLVGESSPMLEVKRLVELTAVGDSHVLVRGEDGTGKTLTARALHGQSARRDRGFALVDVASISAARLEVELFGHCGGPNTRRRDGLLTKAGDGTLVLESIGSLPLPVQDELLRVLDTGIVRPLGGDEERQFQARVISTTSVDIDAAIEAGHLRPELVERLSAAEITLPPLRARGHDVLLLAREFLEAASTKYRAGARHFCEAVADRLLAYGWPGNVRELHNCIEQCAALSRSDEITVSELPQRIREFESRGAPLPHENTHAPLAVVERQYILRVLESVGGNKALAARVLRVGRKTLYRKLEKYGLGASEAASKATQ